MNCPRTMDIIIENRGSIERSSNIMINHINDLKQKHTIWKKMQINVYIVADDDTTTGGIGDMRYQRRRRINNRSNTQMQEE